MLLIKIILFIMLTIIFSLGMFVLKHSNKKEDYSFYLCFILSYVFGILVIF